MKPILKLYRGYANEQELIVMGHVFRPTSIEEYNFQKKNLKNATSVIKMFQIKTQANADVYLDYNGTKIHTKTLNDGYFKFCVPLDQNTSYGWINYQVNILHKGASISTKESYIRPHKGNLGIISDIDDTFLVSHTMNPFKKLYVLLFKNINKRKIFDEVVSHYQALSTAGRENNDEKNAFFYVSSSEWNLYRFIIKFTELHKLPKAVLLLKDIKTSLKDFIFTAHGNHNHKFDKIKHILEFYPNLEYVLLGDDSQQDVFLYESIAKIFPVTVKAVYIRQTTTKQKEKVVAVLKNLESLDVATCYFKHSAEAIAHSKSIGIIE
ncbi:MAG: App1 family protein [Flavobacterium micromati]|jgi:phosphatidate phosphatase APP1|nr:App1 family protein [Flavobacterium micromati]